MNPTVYLICVIVICVVITVFTRATPFLIFGKRELPEAVKYLSHALPPAIMVILVCYCLRNTDFPGQSHGLPEIISCAAVAVIHFIKRNMYLSIIVGTVCYMVLIRVL